MEPLSDADPTQVASYRISARLGAGGMGQVYLAYTPGGRPVALKIVRPELNADPTFRERFRHEVDAARRVHGFYTAQLLDADPAATPPWLVTAYVAGPSLHEAIARYGPMPQDSVFQLMAGVAEALEAIHAAGVVHRDLKPSNVILAQDGPRVIDFGIARASDASSITQTGMRVGSPQFMAPEQILGRPPTPAIDVFALGNLAAYAVLGTPPFGNGDPTVVFARILSQPPDLAGCPQPLRALIEWCLNKDPAARPTPAGVVAACREQQNPHATRIAGTWLPPTMAAALAQHTAPPPPPGYPRTVAASSQIPTGVFISRRAMVLTAVAVVVIGTLIGLTIAAARPTGNTGSGAPPGSPTSSPTSGPTGSHPATSTGSTSTSLSPGLDSCLVGTWRGVSQTATSNIDGTPTEFTSQGPASVTFRSDGTGSLVYGDGVTFTATLVGVPLKEVVTGSETYAYQTSDGSVQLSNVQTSGTETLYLNGIREMSEPLNPKTSLQYTCSGNSVMAHSQDGTVTIQLARAG